MTVNMEGKGGSLLKSRQYKSLEFKWGNFFRILIMSDNRYQNYKPGDIWKSSLQCKYYSIEVDHCIPL